MKINSEDTVNKFSVVLIHILEYCIYALAIGFVVGVIGTQLGMAISWAASLRKAHPWLIFLMPAAGLIIVALYKICHTDLSAGTNELMEAIRDKDNDVPLIYAPLIFIATVLTHLTGGSAGRESAALQLGASLARFVGRHLKLSHQDTRVLTMCGMAAGFTALFGTPVASTLFALEILQNKIRYSALLPVFLACVVTRLVSSLFGAGPEVYLIAEVPALTAIPVLQVFVLSILTAGLSVVMCVTLHETHHLYGTYLKNPWIRIVVGGVVVAAITWFAGPELFAGTGAEVIEEAISGEKLPFYPFLLKLLLVALTLGAGFKGGEIVPTLYIGAAFGNFVGPLLGMNPGFAAAIALIANFAGNTNCPLAAIALSVELFGAPALPFCVLAIFMSYTLSGHFSLYTGQKLMASRFSID